MAAPQGASTCPVVLLVDDEPSVLRFMARVLGDAGFHVETSTSGLHAVSLIAEMPSPPEVVVTDLRMEPIDGNALARLVLAVWPATQFLFVSGFRPSNYPKDLAGPFLRKPFTPEALIERGKCLCGAPGSAARDA